MEKAISLNPTQETSIPELAIIIAKKANYNSNGEDKSSIPIVSRDEKFTAQQPETVSHQRIQGELENAIEAIIHYMYKDVLKSYEEAEVAMNVNCDDEPLLSFHIFNEVDFVAKSLFPHIKFALFPEFDFNMKGNVVLHVGRLVLLSLTCGNNNS